MMWANVWTFLVFLSALQGCWLEINFTTNTKKNCGLDFLNESQKLDLVLSILHALKSINFYLRQDLMCPRLALNLFYSRR